MKYKGAIFTDLDGTFLDPTGKVSTKNIDALNLLSKHNIARVVCTGRTLDSSGEVAPQHLPFDFLIFSSGAGICNFSDRKILCKHEIAHNDIVALADFFLQKQLDFSIHFPIPKNHFFYWYSGPTKSADLISRLHYLKDFAVEGTTTHIKEMKSATQFLAIVHDSMIESVIKEAQNSFANLSFIRATSPLNQNYSWIEVFPKDINKGSGANWLCNYLGISKSHAMAIGNDYNDIHMLEWASPNSYIMADSPKELLEKFKIAPTNAEDGFATAVTQWLQQLKA